MKGDGLSVAYWWDFLSVRVRGVLGDMFHLRIDSSMNQRWGVFCCSRTAPLRQKWVYPTLIRDPGLVGWVKPGAAAWPVRTGD